LDVALAGDGAGELRAVLIGLGHRCIGPDDDADLLVLTGDAATVEVASKRRSVPVLVVADDPSLLPTLAACPVDEVMLRSASAEELAARLVLASRTDRRGRDPLTGLHARPQLIQELGTLAARNQRYEHGFCLALLDVDRFSTFTEHRGRDEGDAVLCQVGAALDSAKRAGDEVYRYGGDEFACVLTGQSLHGGRLAAERLRLAVRDLALPHDGNQPSGVVTVSGGVAAAPAGARRRPEELVEEAESALRRAKDLGRDQVALGG
jgi:diguanylate cyclase (GGDEF)-like protein